MEDSPIALRLKSLIEALGFTDSQFADKCGISRPTLSLLLAGKNKKISDVLLSQIHGAFPEVSILWILFGEGSMFKGEEEDKNEGKSDSENPIFRTGDKEDDEQLNLINVKKLEEIIYQTVSQQFESNFHEMEKIVLKGTEKDVLRKVNKITVYYDDFTFESFTPEKKS